MQTPHHRKIELQSPADLTYLYANTVALARQKLDLHLPPSASNDPNDPDPMRERVRELIDEVRIQTYKKFSCWYIHSCIWIVMQLSLYGLCITRKFRTKCSDGTDIALP